MSTSYCLTCSSSALASFGPSVSDRNEVLDRQGVEYLATETLGSNACTNAFARGVDGCRSASGTTADHQHIEGILGVDLLGLTGSGIGVDLAEDFLQAHAALAEDFAVEVDARHRHDLARLDLFPEQRTVDSHMAHIGVEHSHQVQGLDHIRAVLARQREIGFKGELTFRAWICSITSALALDG